VSQFVLTSAAEGDILELLDYIESDNQPAAAIRVFEALRSAMRLLADRPEIGHTRTDLSYEPVRFWPVFS
jgi:antitoxin ParD1/3/4/toxin ParE1/3/4